MSTLKGDFNFKYITNFDIDSIKKEILKLTPQEWLGDKAIERKKLPRNGAFPLEQSTAYVIKEIDITDLFLMLQISYMTGKPVPVTTVSDKKDLINLIQPLVEYLENYDNGFVGSVLFANLPAGCIIHPHYDYDLNNNTGIGRYMNSIHRYHIPIVTNDDVEFTIDGEQKKMLSGECWEIHNGKYHSVSNLGKEDRIHLIIDIFPKSPNV